VPPDTWAKVEFYWDPFGRRTRSRLVYAVRSREVNAVRLRFERCEAVLPAVEGKYPDDLLTLLPAEYPLSVEVDRKRFAAALRNAMAATKGDGMHPVRLSPGDGVLVMATASTKDPTEEAGTAQEVRAVVTGEPFAVTFNAKLLADTVNAFEGETMVIELSGPESAARIRSGDGRPVDGPEPPVAWQMPIKTSW
jgi:DNA polymerase III sliding clamp (beta) subunit (PCNA family)